MAQLVSALVWGTRGRRGRSGQPDSKVSLEGCYSSIFIMKEKTKKRKLNLNKKDVIAFALEKMLNRKYLRKLLLKKVDRLIYKSVVENNTKNLRKVQVKKYEFLSAMLHCVFKNIEKGYISKDTTKKLIQVFVRNLFTNKKETSGPARKKFQEKYGIQPPSFIVLSPTQKCNLHCSGCYALSSANQPKTLPYEAVDRIVGETYSIFGSRFMTISGGEPFLYHSQGKTLFDIWKKYQNMFFLVYTNGTLIDKNAAKKLAEFGNVTPAISVEGFEKETDKRRGKGVFKKILEAFANLRKAGVPFGISVTATSKNVDILLKDEFYDFYFNRLGASYMWEFQLMPIGRGKELLQLMVSPKKRVELYRKWEDLLKKKICLADFWNSGVLSDGCIAYGRSSGYLYINWDGNIMPCVFIPYYVDNVLELYRKGKTLADALNSPFFKKGREWQKKYGFASNQRKSPDNWLIPCSIRDHYRNFRKKILPKNAKPENEIARQALSSKEYFRALEEYDKELKKMTEKIWQNEYLKEENK